MNDTLSGKYFNIVLGSFPGTIKIPLVIRISESDIKIAGTPVAFQVAGPLQVVRVIIEVESAGRVVSRHSNVLLIDNRSKKITRFEPLATDPNGAQINNFLISVLRPSFKGYDYQVDSYHPQVNVNDRKMCLAYSLQFARDYIFGKRVNAEPIHEFSRKVRDLYPLPEEVEREDIEGHGGLGLGLLGGALIGTAIAAPLIASAAYSRPAVVYGPGYPYYRYY